MDAAQKSGVTIVKATEDDVNIIKTIVDLAYEKYIERIGKKPAPMTADWNSLMSTHSVYVLRTIDTANSDTQRGKVVGAVVLGAAPDAVKINNLVVDPAMQGKGYGKVLMQFAEDTARTEGRPALTLFTNALMHENLVLYPKLGFKETERKVEDGYDRVFFRKELS